MENENRQTENSDAAAERSALSRKPRILAILPGIIPSTSILIIKPLLQLCKSGCIRLKIVLESEAGKKQIQWADLVQFCRNTEPRFRNNLELICSLGIPYIYDLDDNFFELPENTELGAYHRRADRIAQLREYLECADLVRVYSRPMLEYIRPINENAIQTFGPIDFRQIDSTRKKADGRIRLVFSTSSYQNASSSIIEPAVDRILKKYGGRVEAHFWGMRPKALAGLPHVYCHEFIMDYDGFLRTFSRAHYDIGLAPMPDDLFHRSKTNNKFREYGACGIAGVYSDAPVYSSCVQDGETGLLVHNSPDHWFDAIERLIEDQDLLEKLKRQSREFSRRHYSQEQFERRCRDLIGKFAGEKSRRSKRADLHFIPRPSAESEAGISSRISQKIQAWKNWMKVLDKNPVSFFFWQANRILFVRRSLLRYRIEAKTGTFSPSRIRE